MNLRARDYQDNNRRELVDPTGGFDTDHDNEIDLKEKREFGLAFAQQQQQKTSYRPVVSLAEKAELNFSGI